MMRQAPRRDVISRIVQDFYVRVLKSPLLVPYYKGYHMKRIITHQTGG